MPRPRVAHRFFRFAASLVAQQNLLRAELRPSQVATRQRSTTQAYAAHLYRTHPELGALRWCSTIASTLVNLTIFDRAHVHLTLEDAWPLAIAAPEVRAAAELLGLA